MSYRIYPSSRSIQRMNQYYYECQRNDAPYIHVSANGYVKWDYISMSNAHDKAVFALSNEFEREALELWRAKGHRPRKGAARIFPSLACGMTRMKDKAAAMELAELAARYFEKAVKGDSKSQQNPTGSEP